MSQLSDAKLRIYFHSENAQPHLFHTNPSSSLFTNKDSVALSTRKGTCHQIRTDDTVPLCFMYQFVRLFSVHLFAQFLDVIIVDVILVTHQFVNATIRRNLNDSVSHRVDEFVVM